MMKPNFIILLFPAVSAATLPLIWQSLERAQQFLHNPLCRSRVPQFLLDARHPWILENQDYLERLSDTESFLCSHPVFFPSPSPDPDVSPPSENKTLEEEALLPPPDLFDALEVDNNRCGRHRPGWASAAALARARQLTIDIWVHGSDGAYVDLGLLAAEPARPPAELVALSAEVLSLMPGLETLRWNVVSEFAGNFEEGFVVVGGGEGEEEREEEEMVVLPSVRHLELGRQSQFLVRACPGLETLANGGGYEWRHWVSRGKGGDDPGLLLIRAGASARNLARFAMDAGYGGWSTELVQEVLTVMPNLESLGLVGHLSHRSSKNRTDPGGSALKETLRVLSGFEKLTHLDLPSASSLDVGWDGGPWCGNAYDGPEGRKYRQQVLREGAEAEERAVVMVLEMLPRLTGLSIGDSNINLTRNRDGAISVVLPWAGNTEEWAMEAVAREWDEDDEPV